MAHSEKPEMVAAEEEEEEEESLVERTASLDFDLLCSTVALQTQGKWAKFDNLGDHGEDQNGDTGGVLRMWEGEVVLDCFDDRRIALESACCPCYRFGKNMRRAGFGPCLLQGTLYFILAIGAFVNFIAFAVTKRRCYLYLGVAFVVSIGAYLGFFRVQMKRKFNIRGNERYLDDCLYHLICPCCTLAQESRTLEMNNVQDGTWHGRGDKICIGSFGEGTKAFVELHPPPIVSTKSTESCSIMKMMDGDDQTST